MLFRSLEYSFVNQPADLLLDEDDVPDEENNGPQLDSQNGSDQQPNTNGTVELGSNDNTQPQASNNDEIQSEPQAEPQQTNSLDNLDQSATDLNSDSNDSGDVEIDVTDLTKKQDDIESKVNDINSQTKTMFDLLNNLSNKVEKTILNTDSEIQNLKQEFIKRNPTPVEVLQKRITVSDPFNETPKNYWDKKESEGQYKLSDDNDENLEIRASDIDSNASEIYKSFGLDDDELNQSLATMFKI